MQNSIKSEINSITPMDAKEKKTQEEIIEWIDSGAELFRIKKPDVPTKHLVSYFVVVDGDYILLVDHKKAHLWLPTGGHVEPNERPRDTVVREVKEELNIEGQFLIEKPIFLTSTQTVGTTAGHTDVCIWYVLKGDRNIKYDYDTSEFNQIRWFHRDEIPFNQTDPELPRFLDKLYSKI